MPETEQSFRPPKPIVFDKDPDRNWDSSLQNAIGPDLPVYPRKKSPKRTIIAQEPISDVA